MKLTDLVPRVTVETLTPVGDAIGVLYDELERREFENADDIIEQLILLIASKSYYIPVVEYAMINLDRYNPDIDAQSFVGYSQYHYLETVKRQNRVVAKDAYDNMEQAKVAATISALAGIPIELNVNLGKITGTGEYPFMRGVCLVSEDEMHFPIGLKTYQDSWWFVHDPVTGYLVREGVNDKAEAREILTNTLSAEDSTNLDGLAIWLSIMGDIKAPDRLGKLHDTLKSSYVENTVGVDYYVKEMPLWMSRTSGTQIKPPQFRATAKVRKDVLAKHAAPWFLVEDAKLQYRFEDGMSQRKKIDLRRSMVNRIAEQGIQDELAIKPLEDALQAAFPMWLMMSDRQQITQAKAEGAISVSVAADIGTELSGLRTIVQQQMRIAMDAKTSDKQKSGALARAVQASRAIMALRKEAGYFEQNTAAKSGIFQNIDSTVLQDDGAQFDKLIEQLAAQSEVDHE